MRWTKSRRSLRAKITRWTERCVLRHDIDGNERNGSVDDVLRHDNTKFNMLVFSAS